MPDHPRSIGTQHQRNPFLQICINPNKIGEAEMVGFESERDVYIGRGERSYIFFEPKDIFGSEGVSGPVNCMPHSLGPQNLEVPQFSSP